MKKIQMVDLQGQYEPLKAQIQQSFDEVLSSAAFINGPQVQALQKELEQYLQVKHVIPCANGTDALQIAMMGLGLKPGDEVITADFTLHKEILSLVVFPHGGYSSLYRNKSLREDVGLFPLRHLHWHSLGIHLRCPDNEHSHRLLSPFR